MKMVLVIYLIVEIDCRGREHSHNVGGTNKLLAAQINVLDNGVCARIYRNKFVDGRMICGGLKFGHSGACNGTF